MVLHLKIPKNHLDKFILHHHHHHQSHSNSQKTIGKMSDAGIKFGGSWPRDSPTKRPRLEKAPMPISIDMFNDSATADVVLTLVPDHHLATSSDCVAVDERKIYLHSDVIGRASHYFSALLSDRWRHKDESGNSVKVRQLQLLIPATNESFNQYTDVLKMFYMFDLTPAIGSVSNAISYLPIALEILFEECVRACVKYLEAVPWSEEEERQVMSVIPMLGKEEADELLARVTIENTESAEEMLDGLILSATKSHPNMAFAKAFVAKLLRDVTSKASAKKVLDNAFDKALRFLKTAVEEYASPNLRGDHHETEAFQRLSLHKAVMTGKHLMWLVERMIELGVADSAVRAWSAQATLTADLQRALRDDMWKNTVPSLPTVVLRCTNRLAGAVASGNIVAARQVRMNLVSAWLPVLNIIKDSGSSMGPNHKSLCLDLEEIFLKIISTLPMANAQDLLQKCITFSTRNLDECPHLVAAFTTWFRRATTTPQTPDGINLTDLEHQRIPDMSLSD